MSVTFYIHPWEVILWEALIAMNTGICLYILIKIKRGEFAVRPLSTTAKTEVE